MTVELEFTKLEDPFHDSSSFSLLPKTLADRFGSSRLDTAENLFKSLVARGSPKIMQQAQIIANSVSSIDSLYKEGETIDASSKTRGQERRPALGRKRARFSIKPDGPSYSEPNTNISLSIDNIDDPDEYFKAFEDMQDAEKELQKLRGGVLIDVTQQDQGTKTRKRRPGLLGKRASYKHHISEDDAMAETLAKIQEKHHDALNNSSSLIDSEPVDGTVSQTDDKNNKPQKPELEDSVVERENNELDHLLSSYKDLDEGEDETYMREILHLKPIDVCKINLPALPNCTIHAVSELPKKLSPSIRSPLVSVSTFLKKRLSITNLQNDILSFPGEDEADSPDPSSSKSAGNSSDVEPDRVIEPSWNSHPLLDKNTSPKSIGARNRKHRILVHGDSQGDNVQHGTLVFDESDAGVRPHDSQLSTDEVLEDAPHLIGEIAKDDSNASNKDSNVPHANGHVHADGVNYSSELQITNEPGARDKFLVPNVDANLQMPDVRISQEESCPANTNQHGENQHELSNNSTKEHSLLPPSNEARKQKAPKRAVNKRKYSGKQNAAGNSHPPEAIHSSNQPSENQRFLPDKDNEHQVASQTPSNELGTKNAPPQPRKRKVNNKRQSLAGAGTLWEDGRRKSSRHKFRPLEHWRGERLLLGRIHDSLATVIGVKYASPGKNSLKVESYVSAEFADLLNIAAKG